MLLGKSDCWDAWMIDQSIKDCVNTKINSPTSVNIESDEVSSSMCSPISCERS